MVKLIDELEISRMSFEDLDGVIEVEKTAFPIPWPRRSFEEELRNMLACYFVAKLGERVVAYIGMWFVMDECHITNVAVHEDFRRQKIASRLIEKMLEECKEHGTSYIELEVREKNLAAQRLYESFGFQEECVRKDYYKNPDNTRESAIIMVRDFENR